MNTQWNSSTKGITNFSFSCSILLCSALLALLCSILLCLACCLFLLAGERRLTKKRFFEEDLLRFCMDTIKIINYVSPPITKESIFSTGQSIRPCWFRLDSPDPRKSSVQKPLQCKFQLWIG